MVNAIALANALAAVVGAGYIVCRLIAVECSSSGS
jgi:hypothetical protein